MSEWDDLTKTLTIHRTGTETSVPILVEHKEDCIKICVDDGFTDVPDNCFGSYPYLESIQLPDSIKSLGNNIFSQIFCITAIAGNQVNQFVQMPACRCFARVDAAVNIYYMFLVVGKIRVGFSYGEKRHLPAMLAFAYGFNLYTPAPAPLVYSGIEITYSVWRKVGYVNGIMFKPFCDFPIFGRLFGRKSCKVLPVV